MVFSIPSYLCLGDRPRRVEDERGKGVNFSVPFPKSGKGNDAFIRTAEGESTGLYLWNGERNVDAETARRREEMEAAKKNMTPNGFAYSSPAKSGEGLGSYFGCFQRIPYAHVADHPEKQADTIARIRELKAARADPSSSTAAAAPRGIYVSPSQKGCGYGYAGLALSDVGCAYIASFYDQPRRNAAKEREEWAKKMPAEPFKPVGRRGFTFDESTLTGVSKCYVMTAPFKEKKAEKAMVHVTVSAPWRPAGAVPTGPAPIEYWESPYGGYDPRQEPKSTVKKPSEEVFKPSSASDTFWYTQSVVFKRL